MAFVFLGSEGIGDDEDAGMQSLFDAAYLTCAFCQRVIYIFCAWKTRGDTDWAHFCVVSSGRRFDVHLAVNSGGGVVRQLRRVINSCLQSVWNEDWAAKRFQSKPPLIPSQCKETPKGVSMHKVKGLKLILSLAERVSPTFYVWSWAARFHVSFSSDGVCSVLLLSFLSGSSHLLTQEKHNY